MADYRPGWRYSDRKERLPDNWNELKELALERNPERICHWCREPGGHDLDHKVRGDDHRLENLDWIHSRSDFEAGRSKVNCHGQKTGAEGAAARPRLHRPVPVHPAFR